MHNIKIGDYVVRKSHNKDILFKVIDIKYNVCYLQGLNMRIFADSDISDLVRYKNVKDFFMHLDRREYDIYNKFRSYNDTERKCKFGKILHIDGDDIYAKKTLRYYKKNNLPCSVYSIKEKYQPKYIKDLLYKENPSILIITGHDALSKNSNIRDINSYRNSKYFRDSVIQARRVQSDKNKLAIFAGACQSYYEELMNCGANFASSPGRIFIDFFDPLIVAHALSITDNYHIVGMGTIVDKLQEGYRSINGIPTYGKARYI